MARVAGRDIDVESVLVELGIEEIGEPSHDWVKGLCPFHDERRPSFAVNLEHGGWVCRHTGETGGLVKLVNLVLGLEISAAVVWLTGQPERVVPVSKLIKWVDTSPVLSDADERPNDFWACKARYEALDPNKMATYFFDRGFTVKTAREFGVRYDPNGRELIWPARDRNYEAVGFISRKLPGQPDPKYVYNDGFPRNTTLFPLSHFSGAEVVLVEGPLDAMWLHQAGVSGGLSVLGSLSLRQVDLLRRLARKIVLVLDNDEPGKAASERAHGILAGFDLWEVTYAEKDIQEVPLEMVKGVVATAQPALLAMLNKGC